MLSIFLLVMMMSPCLTSAETNNATFLLMTTTENSQEITLAVDQTLKEIENNCLKRATIDTKVSVTCIHAWTSVDVAIVYNIVFGVYSAM